MQYKDIELTSVDNQLIEMFVELFFSFTIPLILYVSRWRLLLLPV